jgi:gluconolactonase
MRIVLRNIALIIGIGVTSCLAQTKVLAPAGTFTDGIEGPIADKWGNVFIVNFSKQGTIGRIDASGKASLFVELPDSAIGNGLDFDSKGNLLVADYVGHRIWTIDTSTKNISLYIKVEQMNQPNDVVWAKSGRIYASDPAWAKGNGNLWMIDEHKQPILLAKQIGTTNGIALSPDQKILYVNESIQRRVWAYSLSNDGNVASKKVLISFPDHGMDGMVCDEQGNIYIARYGAGVVAVYTPSGQLYNTIRLKGQKPTNVAFGGTDWKTLYITLQDDGSVEVYKNTIAGAR